MLAGYVWQDYMPAAKLISCILFTFSSLGIVAVLYPCFLTVFVYYTTDVRDVVIKTA